MPVHGVNGRPLSLVPFYARYSAPNTAGRRSVIDPTLRLALISRSLGDRLCAPLAGWRTTPSRIGRVFRSVGCPSDSGPRGAYRHGPQAHRAAGPDRSYRTIWYGLGGIARKTTCKGETRPRLRSVLRQGDLQSHALMNSTYAKKRVSLAHLPHQGHAGSVLGNHVGHRRTGSYQESDRGAGNQGPSDAEASYSAEAGLERVAHVTNFRVATQTQL
jgi:hypothetical protein